MASPAALTDRSVNLATRLNKKLVNKINTRMESSTTRELAAYRAAIWQIELATRELERLVSE